jgi:TonB family protein
MPTETLPRPFGNYLLTATLGEDGLGRQFRALRTAGEKGFARLRILDAPELSPDALLDAIEENGEVHGFLRNPAVARGVDMDAVDGVPYIAWNEPSGRTVADLQRKCRSLARQIPVEHALLIAEKVATALDHAYNTTIDGDRTLHGLVWPGFVAISDDGEIRLAGFGLAPGVLPSIGRPRLAREIGPYVAPEERNTASVGKNSDVFSVGTLLLELLTGQPPPPDPLATLKGTGAGGPPPVQPEVLAVLRMTLSEAESRYQSSGDLRRELGRLLFSGPYSPSTFNLAYFLNDLFREEIEAETRARRREAALEVAGSSGDSRAATAPEPPARSAATTAPPAHVTGPRITIAEPPRRSPAALVGSLLAAAAVAGGIYVISRRSPPGALRPDRAATAAPAPTLLPELKPTPTGPTSGMTEAQFRDEVSRRVTLETERLVAQMRARAAPSPVRLTGGPVAQPAAFLSAPVAAGPTAVPTATLPPAIAAAPPPEVAVAPQRPDEVPSPLPPTRVAVREGALVAFEALDSPPRIATIVKPAYPPLALKARIGGTVVLRVLVSEKGLPAEVAVLRGAPAGLDGAAVGAVRRWTFTPATKDGVAVRTWMTVPIPFEP